MFDNINITGNEPGHVLWLYIWPNQPKITSQIALLIIGDNSEITKVSSFTYWQQRNVSDYHGDQRMVIKLTPIGVKQAEVMFFALLSSNMIFLISAQRQKQCATKHSRHSRD